ncbi:uncharacterized protein LOC122010958 [Zingiber officinale]|uniref:uncharacterized protein LOC122010958 n=1 Tax=Zingiber officinale TaxID=94328 RepID=UPI001C4DD0AB|nr:uncharacterized protein LOC122010958 [Zingiber officinale]
MALRLRGSQRIEAKPLSQDSHEVQSKNQNYAVVEAPGQDPGPSFIVHSNNKKISLEDIKLRAYYIRLKLKKQIILFNQLLQHQYHLMKFPICPKVPLAPIRNGIHPRPVDDLQIGYPVFQPPILNTLQLHIGPTSFGLPSCQANNGTLAPGTSHPGQMNNDEPSKAAVASACQCKAMPSMPEMAATPEPVASNDHLRFVPPADTTFTSDIDLEFSRDSLRSLGNNWNFSLSDLTTDLTNLGELGDTGDYSGSPILPSDKDIFLSDTGRDAIDLEDDPNESEEDSEDPDKSKEDLGECVENLVEDPIVDPVENPKVVLPEITPNESMLKGIILATALVSVLLGVVMVEPVNGLTAQDRRDLDAYKSG